MKPQRFGPKMIHKKYDPETPKIEVLEDDFPFEYEIHSPNFGEKSGKIPFPYILSLSCCSSNLSLLDLLGGIIFIPMIQENSAGAAGDRTPARWAL